MSRWYLCAVAVGLAVSAIPASGDVILMAGSVFAAPGSTGNTIEVDLINTGLSPIDVAAFEFQIGVDPTSGIDLTGAESSTFALYIFAGSSVDDSIPAPLNLTTGSSLLASDSTSLFATGVTVSAGQTVGLGLVTFDVSPAAALGPVDVLFSTDPAFTDLSSPSGDSIPIDSFMNGSIEVGDVAPEPSTAAMLLAALMGLGAWRLRRLAG